VKRLAKWRADLSWWWRVELDDEERGILKYGPAAMLGTLVWIVVAAAAIKYAGVQ
jgi:hypothetical protein